MEDHNLVNTVDELWTEHTLQPFHCLRTDDFIVLIAGILTFCRQEANAHCPLHISTASIAGHNHYSVLKVYRATLTIS